MDTFYSTAIDQWDSTLASTHQLVTTAGDKLAQLYSQLPSTSNIQLQVMTAEGQRLVQLCLDSWAELQKQLTEKLPQLQQLVRQIGTEVDPLYVYCAAAVIVLFFTLLLLRRLYKRWKLKSNSLEESNPTTPQHTTEKNREAVPVRPARKPWTPKTVESPSSKQEVSAKGTETSSRFQWKRSLPEVKMGKSGGGASNTDQFPARVFQLKIDPDAKPIEETRKARKEEINLLRTMGKEFRELIKLDEAGAANREERLKDMEQIKSARTFFRKADQGSMQEQVRERFKVEEENLEGTGLSVADLNIVKRRSNFYENSANKSTALSQFQPGKLTSINKLFEGEKPDNKERVKSPRRKLINFEEIMKKDNSDIELQRELRAREIEELKEARQKWIISSEGEEEAMPGGTGERKVQEVRRISSSRYNPEARSEKTRSCIEVKRINIADIFKEGDRPASSQDAREPHLTQELEQVRNCRKTPLAKRWQPRKMDEVVAANGAVRSQSAHVLQRAKLPDNSWVQEKSQTNEEDRLRRMEEIESLKKTIKNVSGDDEEIANRSKLQQAQKKKELEEVKALRSGINKEDVRSTGRKIERNIQSSEKLRKKESKTESFLKSSKQTQVSKSANTSPERAVVVTPPPSILVTSTTVPALEDSSVCCTTVTQHIAEKHKQHVVRSKSSTTVRPDKQKLKPAETPAANQMSSSGEKKTVTIRIDGEEKKNLAVASVGNPVVVKEMPNQIKKVSLEEKSMVAGKTKKEESDSVKTTASKPATVQKKLSGDASKSVGVIKPAAQLNGTSSIKGSPSASSASAQVSSAHLGELPPNMERCNLKAKAADPTKFLLATKVVNCTPRPFTPVTSSNTPLPPLPNIPSETSSVSPSNASKTWTPTYSPNGSQEYAGVKKVATVDKAAVENPPSSSGKTTLKSATTVNKSAKKNVSVDTAEKVEGDIKADKIAIKAKNPEQTELYKKLLSGEDCNGSEHKSQVETPVPAFSQPEKPGKEEVNEVAGVVSPPEEEDPAVNGEGADSQTKKRSEKKMSERLRRFRDKTTEEVLKIRSRSLYRNQRTEAEDSEARDNVAKSPRSQSESRGQKAGKLIKDFKTHLLGRR